MIGTMDSAWLLPVFCAAAFLILALGSLWGYARFLPDEGSFISILAVAAGFVLFWPIAGDLLARGAHEVAVRWFEAGDASLTWGIVLDPLSVSMLGLVVTVALCVQVYSVAYMRDHHGHPEPRYTWYYAAHSLFTAAMLTLILADNYLLLYIAWELVGLCSYLLIGFYYDRRSAAEASKKAFITTRLGDVGMFIGILLLFRATGTFQMSAIFEAAEHGALDLGLISLASFLIFLGAMGKSAQVPFHVWLPDAMEGPTPVSALIHAATMVAAGVYLVARSYPLFTLAPGVMLFITVVGLLTTMLGASIALVVTDIKRVIAYSTVSKLGFMMVALGSGGAGFTAAIFYLVTHGFFKALLFLGAGSVIHSTGSQDLDQLQGLGRKMPVTSGVFLIASLALAGIFPLSGFWSKDLVMDALLNGSGIAVYLLALVSLFLSGAYVGRLWFRLFLGPLSPDAAHAHESPALMTAPMLVLAFLSVVSGLVVLPAAGQALGLHGGIGGFLYHEEPEAFRLDIVMALVSTIVSLAGLAIAAGFYMTGSWSPAALQARFSGLHHALEHRLYFDDAYQWLIDHLVLAGARIVAWFDRAVVNDIGINGPGIGAAVAGAWLRYTQTGRLPNYALTMALGAIVLGAAAFTFIR